MEYYFEGSKLRYAPSQTIENSFDNLAHFHAQFTASSFRSNPAIATSANSGSSGGGIPPIRANPPAPVMHDDDPMLILAGSHDNAGSVYFDLGNTHANNPLASSSAQRELDQYLGLEVGSHSASRTPSLLFSGYGISSASNGNGMSVDNHVMMSNSKPRASFDETMAVSPSNYMMGSPLPIQSHLSSSSSAAQIYYGGAPAGNMNGGFNHSSSAAPQAVQPPRMSSISNPLMPLANMHNPAANVRIYDIEIPENGVGSLPKAVSNSYKDAAGYGLLDSELDMLCNGGGSTQMEY